MQDQSPARYVYLPLLLAVAGAAIAVVGWVVSPSTSLYIVGVVVAVISSYFAVGRGKGRKLVGLLVALALLIAGAVIPWVATKVAYASDAPVVSAVDGRTPYSFSAVPGPEAPILATRNEVIALAPDGSVRWRTDFEPSLFMALGDQRTLIAAADAESMVIDSAGDFTLIDLGPRPLPIAADGDVLVLEECDDNDVCVIIGYSVHDGTPLWTLEGRRDRGAYAVGLDFADTRAWQPPAWFATAAPDGSVEVRSAETGDIVSTLAPGVRVATTPTAFATVEQTGEVCTIAVQRNDGSRTDPTPIDCAAGQLENPETPVLRALSTGDALIMYLGGREARDGAVVVNLLTGSVRNLPENPTAVDRGSFRVQEVYISWGSIGFGAGLQVDRVDGELIARDAATGDELWRTPVGLRDRVDMLDELVVVQSSSTTLPLHELFAPADADSELMRVFDARTGKLVDSIRTGHGGRSFVEIAGSWGVARVHDGHGEMRVILVGGNA